MKYRTIIVYFTAFVLLFGLWYAAFDLNSNYWGYVNENWQAVRFNPFTPFGRWWTLLIALVGCFLTLMSAIFVIGMTLTVLMEARKEYKNWRQLELF